MYILKYRLLRLITYPFKVRLAIVLSTSLVCLLLYILCLPMYGGMITIIPLLLTCFLFKYRGFFVIITCLAIMMFLKHAIAFPHRYWYGPIFFVMITGFIYSIVVGLFICALRHSIDLVLLSRQQIIMAEKEKIHAYEQQQKAVAAEHRLVLAYEQQQQINQQKDLFLAHVNHELSTPLVTVSGYLELLLSYHEHLGEDKKISYMRKAMDSTQELNQLVTNLLDTAQLSAHYPSPYYEQLSPLQVTQEVLAAWNPRDLHDFTFSVEISEKLTAWADRRFLSHILRNLLSNACKYAPKYTTVHIIASHHTSAEIPEICFSVRDEGKGVPPDQATLLFERFVRLPQDIVGTVRGTGLGLYICKKLVETQGGRIWIDTSTHAGTGSCFCFTLPATRPEHVV